MDFAYLHNVLTECNFNALKLKRPDLFTLSGVNTLYKNVMHCLLNCSIKCFEMKDCNRKQTRKWWWDDSLRESKAKSIELYNKWLADGFPKHGDSLIIFIIAKRHIIN